MSLIGRRRCQSDGLDEADTIGRKGGGEGRVEGLLTSIGEP